MSLVAKKDPDFTIKGTFNWFVYDIMRRHGCPAHYEMWARFIHNDHNPSPQFTNKVYRVIRLLTMQDYIRRVRPGVYSAYGPERD